MRNITSIIVVITALNTYALPDPEVAPEKVSIASQADQLLKDKKYKDAIVLFEQAIKAAKTDSVEGILSKHKLMASQGWAHRMLREQDEYKKVLEARFEMITVAAKKHPDNVAIARAQITDLGAMSGLHNMVKENNAVIKLRLQAVALADGLVAKNAGDQEAMFTQFNAKLALAKAYRWSKEQRHETLPVVDEALAILGKIDPETIPEWMTREYLIYLTLSNKVAVQTLSKEYKNALETNTFLLEKTKPLLTNKIATAYHISDLTGSYYQQALLYEKLGEKETAQQNLQNLLNMIDSALERYPDNDRLLSDKKRFEKWKGNELR
ncbi:MAG: hypothetical protein ACSHX6_12775 [Akkermansiaceae bacterium]